MFLALISILPLLTRCTSVHDVLCFALTTHPKLCNILHGEVYATCIHINCDQDTVDSQPDVTKFIEFIDTHSKVYNTIHTFMHKFDTFKDNMKFIIQENNKNNSYILGTNVLADLSHEEYIQMFTSNTYTIPKNYCDDDELNDTDIESIDWRQKGAVTNVKDQGQCGSCWAFSTTGAVEGINAIANGDLISFSEQELVDCASSYGNHGCNGGLMQRAFSYVMDNGLTTETEYPYTSGDTKTEGSCKSFNPSGYINGCSNVQPNELQLTIASSNQPVSVSIEADSRSFQLYSSGVYDSADCGTQLDHGVLLVGYGTSDEMNDYYIVKNSWSNSWGDDGYIYMARNSVEDSKEGMCGIAMDASYPTVTK